MVGLWKIPLELGWWLGVPLFQETQFMLLFFWRTTGLRGRSFMKRWTTSLQHTATRMSDVQILNWIVSVQVLTFASRTEYSTASLFFKRSWRWHHMTSMSQWWEPKRHMFFVCVCVSCVSVTFPNHVYNPSFLWTNPSFVGCQAGVVALTYMPFGGPVLGAFTADCRCLSSGCSEGP